MAGSEGPAPHLRDEGDLCSEPAGVPGSPGAAALAHASTPGQPPCRASDALAGPLPKRSAPGPLPRPSRAPSPFSLSCSSCRLSPSVAVTAGALRGTESRRYDSGSLVAVREQQAPEICRLRPGPRRAAAGHLQGQPG